MHKDQYFEIICKGHVFFTSYFWVENCRAVIVKGQINLFISATLHPMQLSAGLKAVNFILGSYKPTYNLQTNRLYIHQNCKLTKVVRQWL